MKRFLIPVLLAFGAVTLLGLQPAAAPPAVLEGTVTATPATIEAGETVDIKLEGNCWYVNEQAVDPTAHGGPLHIIVTITDPNGATVFTKTFDGVGPIIEFSFSDTPTLGTYTVTADCEALAPAAEAEVIGSYTPAEFTVVEAEAEAADAEPADVVAATPTFTG